MRARRRILIFLVPAAMLAIALLTGCSAGRKDDVKYHCPMHPTVVSDKPGSCPICGMDLVPIEKPAEKPAVPTGTIPGRAAVSITPEKARLMNVKYGVVEKKNLSRDIMTSAIIVPSEQRVSRITTKVEGWVEKLFVGVSGQFVKNGDPLLSIYSPDLVATEQEFLSALSIAESLSKSPYPSVADSGKDLVEASRRRLLLWDVSEKQIEKLRSSKQVEKAVTIYSPVSGYVMEKDVLQGQKVMAGEPLMTVADLSTVWAEADIYEQDVPFIKAGMEAVVTLSYMPGKEFKGKVAFMNPYLDPASRTAKARIEIANPALDLKPQMYAEARFSYDLGEKLALPASAVMRTGERDYVFAADDDGAITPIEVKLGARAGDYYEVESGLAEGRKVITSANFLIDSESSLKAALEAVSGGK